jgi:thiol-disulfide isomerase/thioredoxin
MLSAFWKYTMTHDSLLQPRILHAPAFAPGEWLNIPQPLSLASLRGRPFLIDIWEYSCINCLRTLPYLREWHRRYHPWLTIIGVHTPEFPFGKERAQVEQAVREWEIAYPVYLDNDLALWEAYANRYWPAKYLVDSHGYIRYQSYGEGGYGSFERAIQEVLREDQPTLSLPPLMQPLRDEDQPGAVCYRPTPELHGGLDRGALGNPEGYARGVPMMYALPQERRPGWFYVSGVWQAGLEYLAYQGSSEAFIQLPYEAVDVNVVLTPHVELIERMLHPEPVTVEVWQDGKPLTEANRGRDVTPAGRILVDRPRMFHLVHNPGFEPHELTLRVTTKGLALYAFSFTGCVKPS